MKKNVSIVPTSKTSLGVTIPKIFCEILELKKGEKIEMELKSLKANEIIFRKVIKEEE